MKDIKLKIQAGTQTSWRIKKNKINTPRHFITQIAENYRLLVDKISVRGQIENILVFEGHSIPVTTIKLCDEQP